MNRRAVVILALATAFLYLPIAVLAVFSFNASRLMAFPLSGFTLDWYRSLAANTKFQGGFVTSFLIAQPVGVASAALGLGGALALVSAHRSIRIGLAALLLMPFLVPKTVLCIAQSMVLARFGLDRGATTLIAAQTIVAVPFTTALIASVLAGLDHRLEEAARDLGASPWVCFRRITFPQIRPAVSAAYSIGVILSLADLTIGLYLAGRTQPLSLIVASEFRRELSPDLNAMQVSVLILTAIIVVVTEGYGRLRAVCRRRTAPRSPSLASTERVA
ncbi:ABC transporter permease subunit [Lichenihabitans sp. Uapishka_5]|uniref:ABC transporter permease n=1 Tax=Lichenihabitans sp. Uapishka_5 TaxID=3037302 RepID=UPI0029E810DC|nr:ABC transporter permease subunit [Lichenihabitans sp. Uapishka_5]MDX7953416.1 ABC transporter permease subunit [Lichenihabitans sp. Uapishka_5]